MKHRQERSLAGTQTRSLSGRAGTGWLTKTPSYPEGTVQTACYCHLMPAGRRTGAGVGDTLMRDGDSSLILTHGWVHHGGHVAEKLVHQTYWWQIFVLVSPWPKVVYPQYGSFLAHHLATISLVIFISILSCILTSLPFKIFIFKIKCYSYCFLTFFV